MFSILCSFFLLLCQNSYAEVWVDDILVSSKRDQDISQTTLPIEVIEDFNTELIVEQLKRIPAIDVIQTGPAGSQTSLAIRGSESRHVLVLIDGVAINDPSTTSKEANINLLNINDVEKIEIIKGSQTLLYGTDALGGIINIIMKSKTKDSWVAQNTSSFGKKTSIGSGVNTKSLSIVTNAYTDQFKGPSSFKNGREDDGYEARGFFIKTNYKNKRLNNTFFYKLDDQFSEFDYSAQLEEGVFSKTTHQVLSNEFRYQLSQMMFTYKVSLNKVDRPNKFMPNSEIHYEGSELTHNVSLSKKNLVYGIEYNSEQFKQSHIERESMESQSLYFIKDWSKDAVEGNLGVRTINQKDYGTHLVPALGIRKNYKKSSISINAQGGFKAPSLYQMYGIDPSFGKIENKNLAPEKSNSLDFNYRYEQWFLFQLYHQKITDVIIDNFSTPENDGELEISGMEIGITHSSQNYRFSNKMFFVHHYQSSGELFLRRPPYKNSSTISYFLTDKSLIEYNWQLVGRRFDRDFNSSRNVELAAFDISSIHYQYFHKSYELSLGVNNIFDREYEMAYGYSNMPLNGFIRLKYLF